MFGRHAALRSRCRRLVSLGNDFHLQSLVCTVGHRLGSSSTETPQLRAALEPVPLATSIELTFASMTRQHPLADAGLYVHDLASKTTIYTLSWTQLWGQRPSELAGRSLCASPRAGLLSRPEQCSPEHTSSKMRSPVSARVSRVDSPPPRWHRRRCVP